MQYQYQYPGNHNPNTYDVWTVDRKTGMEIGNWTQNMN